MTRIIFSFVLVCSLVVLLNAQTVSVRPVGLGTEESPFLIESLANLRWFSEENEYWGELDFETLEVVSRYYFRQTSNIDASETKYWNDGSGFIRLSARFNYTLFFAF